MLSILMAYISVWWQNNCHKTLSTPQGCKTPGVIKWLYLVLTSVRSIRRSKTEVEKEEGLCHLWSLTSLSIQTSFPRRWKKKGLGLLGPFGTLKACLSQVLGSSSALKLDKWQSPRVLPHRPTPPHPAPWHWLTSARGRGLQPYVTPERVPAKLKPLLLHSCRLPPHTQMRQIGPVVQEFTFWKPAGTT